MKKGQLVAIINQALDGRFFVEGRALLVLLPRSIGEPATVIFERDKVGCQRFVDPAAQADPEAYVAELNARIAQEARS